VQPKGPPVYSAELVGHDGPVWQLSWAHPKFGSILASCSYDRKVIVWKEERPKHWQKLYEYTGHELSVNSIAWAPQEFGLVLAMGSSDGHVSVLTWKGGSDWAKVKFLGHSSGVNAVSWAPAALPMALTVQRTGPDTNLVPRFVTGGCDNLVKIWQRNPGTNEWQLETTLTEGHSDWVRDVAWAPSIGLPYSIIASCSQDQTVLIWTQTDPNGTWNKTALDYKFNSAVWRVSWSVTGNILAVSCGDNKVTLWKESTGAGDDRWLLISELDESEASGVPKQ